MEGLISLFFLPGSHSSLFFRCGSWQAIRPLISQSSSFVLGTLERPLQPLWLGTRARAAGESSRYLGSERAAGQPIELPRVGKLARRKLLVQPPWCYDTRQPLCAWETRIQPALRLVSAQPAEPEALCLGARSSRQGLETLGWAGPPWDRIMRYSVPRFWVCGWSS